MTQRFRVNGTEYTLLERLPTLGSEAAYILCVDNDGNRVLCPEELWRGGELAENQIPSVNTHSSAQQKIDLFLSLFKGREDVYAKRYHSAKTEKSGYMTVCKNEWAYGLCDKKKYRCPDCPHREFLPLTAEAVRAHLMGHDPLCRDVAAIYPMREDNTTWLLAADFDEADWRADVSAFRRCCEEAGLTPAVERSRSGNGAHVRFFFSEPVPAADARRLGSALLTRTMAQRHELSFASYDRLFPAQDTVPNGGFGNLIALPFQGQAQKAGNTLFVDEQLVPYPDQWAFLSSIPKISPEELNACLRSLCCDSDLGMLADTEEKPAPWQRRRGQIALARTDFPSIVKVTMANLLYIKKAGFSQAALDALKRLAAFPNPEFRSRQAMRLPVYGTPRVLDYGYEDDTYIGLPRGCRDALGELLEQHDVSMSTEDKRCAGRNIRVAFNGTLRPEQEPAAQALLAEDAVRLVREGRSPILLTERKEHAAQLAALLEPQVDNVFLLVGSDTPREKREKLAALQAVPAGEQIAVVATGKYIGEGFDSPRLDTLLLAMPISWKGTLAQYAGRLHRNYEGKHEVRIYDYVDVHIPMLERMYHKRLKGYAELGYQIRFGAADDRVSVLYDGHAAMAAFEQELSNAARSVMILSPYQQKGRVSRLLPILQGAVSRGVKITICTGDVSDAEERHQAEAIAAVDSLKGLGVEVVLRKGLTQRCAIIDASVVWYGNVDLLAFGRKDADVLRFENADIAGELLYLTDETECEQLLIAEGAGN